LSFYNYAFEAVIVNEMTDLALWDHKLGLDIQVPGPIILDMFGFQVNSYWSDVVNLTWMFVAFLVAACVILQLWVKERR
jgi:hypothetical protein